jgi:hypothetical protein
MARRSTSQFKLDDLAFPIRLKFVVPSGGLQMLAIDTHAWLRDNLDHLAWAWGPAQTIGSQATAYYFRSLADAQRFVDAFPQLQIADGVALRVYSSPGKGAAGPKQG